MRDPEKQLDAVFKELNVKDEGYSKHRCPICKGFGVATGKLAGVALGPDEEGDCYYCDGLGVVWVVV